MDSFSVSDSGCRVVSNMEVERKDLNDDSTLFLWLLSDLERRAGLIADSSREDAFDARIIKILENGIAELHTLISHMSYGIREKQLVELFTLRSQIRTRIRQLSVLLSTSLCMENWQSPSLAASVQARSGIFPASIQDFSSDYRRCWYALGERYEEQFAREFVAAPEGWHTKSLVTNCGMSAFTTAICHAQSHFRRAIERVLVHSSSYHENLFVLRQLLPRSVDVRVTSSDAEFSDLLKRFAPDVVYLDSLSNTLSLERPELHSVARGMPAESTLIVDNTCLGPLCNPYAILGALPTRSVLYVVESLIKLHSHGLDLANSGIVTLCSQDEECLADLQRFRTHLGTHIAERELATLPSPSAQMLQARLARIARNNAILGRLVNSTERMTVRSREGAPFITIDIKDMSRQTYIDRVLQLARERRVDIVHSTAFGFDETRIYSVESAIPSLASFLRVSAGMETEGEMEAIASCLKDAIT